LCCDLDAAGPTLGRLVHRAVERDMAVDLQIFSRGRRGSLTSSTTLSRYDQHVRIEQRLLLRLSVCDLIENGEKSFKRIIDNEMPLTTV
jgi:hypothetical protein